MSSFNGDFIMNLEEKIGQAIEGTEIMKPPAKLLALFDSTTIHYYLLTVPMYLDFEGRSPESETVIREGMITWQRGKLEKAFEILAEEDSDLAMILCGEEFAEDSTLLS